MRRLPNKGDTIHRAKHQVKHRGSYGSHFLSVCDEKVHYHVSTHSDKKTTCTECLRFILMKRELEVEELKQRLESLC